MTRKKKDNPMVLAGLGVVMVVALGFVGKTLFSGDPQQAAHAAASSAATAQAEAPRTAVGEITLSSRDPFSSPRLEAASLKQVGPGSATNSLFQPPVRPVRYVRPSTPLGPAPVLTPLVGNFRIRPLPSHQGEVDPAAVAAEEERIARALKVTAIVMGSRPYAVVEPIGGIPRTLHSAEPFHTLRVVVIRPGEIVLKGQSGIWTLPLATPENEQGRADGK